MAKTGRPRIPTKLHILHGHPGHHPLNLDEPQPEEAAPEIPSFLSAEAVLEWHRITKELLALRILTRVDRAALAAYCQAWGRWVEAEDKMRTTPIVFKSPNGYPVLSPWWSIANKAMEQMRNFLTEFGLSPASRTRIKGGAAPEERPQGARRFLA
jgi:P27 family predicted phage terminase small subunit